MNLLRLTVLVYSSYVLFLLCVAPVEVDMADGSSDKVSSLLFNFLKSFVE